MNQGVHAAPGSAADDAEEAPDRQVAEVHREIGDDQEVVRLGDSAGLCVEFRDGGVLVAEVKLGDFFDVLVQLNEPLLDVFGLRPDAAIDQAVLVIGQVHEAGEALAEAHGIQDGKHDATGRRNGEQPQHQVVKRSDGQVASRILRLKKN